MPFTLQRKCHTPDVHTTCRRCVTHELVCEYKKHRRGRRKKETTEASLAPADASPSSLPAVPLQPPVYPPLPPPPGRRASTYGSAQGTAESLASQSPAGAGAASKIQFSHVVREGDSSRAFSRDTPQSELTLMTCLRSLHCRALDGSTTSIGRRFLRPASQRLPRPSPSWSAQRARRL